MSFEWMKNQENVWPQTTWNPNLDEVVTFSSSQVEWTLLTKEQFLEKLKDRLNLKLIEVTPVKYFEWFRVFEIYDDKDNFIWKVEVRFYEKEKIIKPRFIIIFSGFKWLWYWTSVYKQLQENFLWYTLTSDEDVVNRKTDKNQEKWDAVYLWESLCREWVALDLWNWNYRFNNNI